MLDREAKREKTLEGLQREKRLKQQAAAAKAGGARPGSSKPPAATPAASGEDVMMMAIRQAEEEFETLSKSAGWRSELEKEANERKNNATA